MNLLYTPTYSMDGRDHLDLLFYINTDYINLRDSKTLIENYIEV